MIFLHEARKTRILEKLSPKLSTFDAHDTYMGTLVNAFSAIWTGGGGGGGKMTP